MRSKTSTLRLTDHDPLPENFNYGTKCREWNIYAKTAVSAHGIDEVVCPKVGSQFYETICWSENQTPLENARLIILEALKIREYFVPSGATGQECFDPAG